MNARPKSIVPATLGPGAPWPQVAQLLGDLAADALSRDFGGRRLYVPKSVGAHHPITASIGHEAALRLCEFMAGQNLEPPITAVKWARILALSAGGMQRAKVAREVGCTERHVYYVLQKTAEADAENAKADQRQGDLFKPRA